jgi:hypothetical protein
MDHYYECLPSLRRASVGVTYTILLVNSQTQSLGVWTTSFEETWYKRLFAIIQTLSSHMRYQSLWPFSPVFKTMYFTQEFGIPGKNEYWRMSSQSWEERKSTQTDPLSYLQSQQCLLLRRKLAPCWSSTASVAMECIFTIFVFHPESPSLLQAWGQGALECLHYILSQHWQEFECTTGGQSQYIFKYWLIQEEVSTYWPLPAVARNRFVWSGW